MYFPIINSVCIKFICDMIVYYYFFYFTGNDVIHKLTNRLLNSLYVYFRFNNNSIFHQKYAEFSVGAESTNYQLHLAGPTTGSLGTWQEVLLSTKSLIFFLGIIFDTGKANKFYDESYKDITNRLKNIFLIIRWSICKLNVLISTIFP